MVAGHDPIIGVDPRPAIVNLDRAPGFQTNGPQALVEGRDIDRRFRIVFRVPHKKADAARPYRLLRVAAVGPSASRSAIHPSTWRRLLRPTATASLLAFPNRSLA